MPSPAPDSPRERLRRRALQGAGFGVAAQGGKTLLDAGAQLLLLALIAPSHLGVFAFAQALAGFASCFSDLAGQKFILRAKRIGRRAVATVFWLELALGVAVAGAWAIACGPLLESMGRAEQIPFARALALWIVLERLILPRALLERAMRFGVSNSALFLGTAAGSAALLASAWLGAGAWSLVLGLLVRAGSTALLMFRATRFRPRFEFDPRAALELARFGLPLMGTTALVFAYTNVDYIIVGQMAGLSALGLYTAGYRYPHYLMQLSTVLSSVVLSSFAKAADEQHLRRGFRLLTRYAGMIAFVFPAAMWTQGPWLVEVLLPSRWAGALFPLQVFTTLAALRLALVHWGHVFVLRGRTTPMLWVGLANLPLVAGSAAAGVALAGIEGAAVGVAASSGATLVACCAWLLKGQLPGFSYIEALGPPLRCLLAFLVAALAVEAGWAAAGLPASGAASLASGFGAYALVAWTTMGSEIRRVAGLRRAAAATQSSD